jgi:two-component system NtrC family sensor kinase
MKTSTTTYLLSVLLMLLCGLAATAYLAIQINKEANKNWVNASFREAEQVTNIFVGWLDRENETFKGIASLFYATEDISQEEFAAAIDVIEQTELSIRQLSVAFIFKSRTNRLIAGLTAGNEDLWQVNHPLANDMPSSIPIYQTVTRALDSPARPVVGPVFTSKSGAHMVILAFVVQNSDTLGVLLSAVNLDTLLLSINALHVPPGLHFSLALDDNDLLSVESLPNDLEMVASKSLRVKGVDKEWDFIWSTDSRYQGGPDTSMATATVIGGVMISFLLTMLGWNQARQNKQIRQKVIEKTTQLENAQEQLVQAEKMASLGSLVAGISHELNTPIGIALTASTSLMSLTDDIKAKMATNTLKKSSLNHYFEQAHAATELVESNINRATELITSFKQVAVDQTSERRRVFNLKHAIQDVIKTLTPKLKSISHSVSIEVEENIEMNSYPGPLGQILTNFVTNSLIHAFEGRSRGEMRLHGHREGHSVILIYTDNGCGIDEEGLLKIFDPFYTSKLGKGGSGLGLNVVYNLCTGILDGEIDVVNDNGLIFTIKLPLEPKALN